MKDINVQKTRKLSQQYAYTSIQMHEAIARKAGLPGTDHKYLGFIMEKGQMTAGELSELTGLTTGAVTGLIDRFEKRSLSRGSLHRMTGGRCLSFRTVKRSWSYLFRFIRTFAISPTS